MELFMTVFYLTLLTICVVRLLRGYFGRAQTVKAEVIGKQTVEQFSKSSGSGKRVKYVVIFSAEGEKLSFYVSEFSYNGYHKGEKGTLTYKGKRLVDFH